MRNEPKQRGSALMMVVGLLTMIGMLGSTFLIITRLDARQSMILESKSQATPLGAGIVARAADIVVEYMKMDSDGPHGAVRAGMAGWVDMLYYPDDTLAKHLALDAVAVPHKSDILGTSADLVDCDQDGTDDAYLKASGVVNSSSGTPEWTTIPKPCRVRAPASTITGVRWSRSSPSRAQPPLPEHPRSPAGPWTRTKQRVAKEQPRQSPSRVSIWVKDIRSKWC